MKFLIFYASRKLIHLNREFEHKRRKPFENRSSAESWSTFHSENVTSIIKLLEYSNKYFIS